MNEQINKYTNKYKYVRTYCVHTVPYTYTLIIFEIGGFGVVMARINTDPDNYEPFVFQVGTMGVAAVLTVSETALVIVGLRSFRSHNESEKKYVVRMQGNLRTGNGDMDNPSVSHACCIASSNDYIPGATI